MSLTKHPSSKVLLLVCIFMSSIVNAAVDKSLTDQQLYALAREAYLYAYPIVSMDITYQQATNVEDAQQISLRAPVNQFSHAREYPGADAKEIVRFNFDTLYSFAWLDVSKEPIIISFAASKDRYFLLPMLDMWTDVFAVIGTRTHGNDAGSYAIVSQQWRGELPAGVEKIVAPTDLIWVIGRIKTDGAEDYENVHAIQDQLALTPLSAWGKPKAQPAKHTPLATIDNKTPPMLQVDALSGVQLLERLQTLLNRFPPHGNDYPLLMQLKKMGVSAGGSFQASDLSAAQAEIVNRAAKDTLSGMQKAWESSGKFVNGWIITNDNIGTYGTSYLRRALVAKGGLGANLPQDAVYPTAVLDADGQPFAANQHYVLHFDKQELPPVDAFWSLTMYDMDGFQVANELNRFSLSSHSKLNYNADGSLDIYIQASKPSADKLSNWLPAPNARFQPNLRLYSPRANVLDGSWQPPPIKKVSP